MKTPVCIFTIFVLAATFAFYPLPASADQLYVKGHIVIGIKNSPYDSAPSIAFTRTGDLLEIITERGDYMLVRSSDGTEGWVQSRYLVAERPAAAVVDDIKKKNELLSEKLRQLEASGIEVSEQLQSARAESELYKKSLSEARQQYNDLAEMSQHVQSISAERDLLKAQVRKLRDESGLFIQIKSAFANTEFLLWFLAGGGVLLVGWLAGRSSPRGRYY